MSAGGQRQGKAALMQELDARFRAPLMAYFLRRLRNRQDAKDLTQETFLRLVATERLDHVDQANAYVFRVAGNLLHDRARLAARRGNPQFVPEGPPWDEIVSKFASDLEPERVLIGQESVAEVLSCLAELGERAKNIFILIRLEGMKKRDIASLYGVSLSTVERQFALAVAHLTHRFGREAP